MQNSLVTNTTFMQVNIRLCNRHVIPITQIILKYTNQDKTAFTNTFVTSADGLQNSGVQKITLLE